MNKYDIIIFYRNDTEAYHEKLTIEVIKHILENEIKEIKRIDII